MNRGDREIARELASAVLANDAVNRDAYAILAESATNGEMRRASLLFVDLVGSTELSERHEPELYRSVITRYKAVCRDVIVQRYGGHVSHIAGDGLLAVFGLPRPHEDDAERAVQTALDIAVELEGLSAEVHAAVGERLAVRSGVHKGVVYVDLDDNEVYGLAANVTARLHSLANPGTVVISEEMREVVGHLFETVVEPAQSVKGVTKPLRPVRVVGRRRRSGSGHQDRAAPMVGRAPERAALRRAWDDARSTGGTVAVHLVGEPGVGKSRLCSWLVDELRREAGVCVELRGEPLLVDAAFHPVRRYIESRLEADGVPGTSRLARLEHDVVDRGLDAATDVPLLAAVAGITLGPEFTAPEAAGRKLHEAVVDAAARYVVACAGPGPAVLVAEDLHWFDQSTLDVVDRLPSTDSDGLLILSTSRELPSPRAVSGSTVLHVEALDVDTARELVRSLDPSVGAEACDDLVARSDGVPLFLEQLVHDAGPTPTRAGVVPTDEVHDAVPSAVYELLVSRLYTTPAAVPVAGAAATIGRDVDRQQLERIVDLPGPELTRALGDLVNALILDGDEDGGHYRFRHELLREVAYGLQPPSRRRTLHARLADSMTIASGADAVDWQVVARHYDDAGRWGDAVQAYRRAADGIQRVGALGQARALLERAIALAAELPQTPDWGRHEVGLRLRRGFLAVAAEGNSSVDAARDYERCLELTVSDPTSDEMFSTLISLWGHYVMRGNLARAEQVVELLHSNLGGERAAYAPENLGAFGVLDWYRGDFIGAARRLEAAVAGLATRRSEDHYEKTWFLPTDGRASIQVFLALARAVRGDDVGADDQIRAALQRCREIEFPHGPTTAATVQLYHGWVLMERGDLDAAAAVVGDVQALADRHGFDIMALASALQGATIGGLVGVSSETEPSALAAQAQVLDGLIGMWRALDIAVFAPFYMGVSARVRAGAGDAGGALARVDEALALADDTGMHFYDAELLRVRATVGSPQRRVDDDLEAARELARAQGAIMFERRIAQDQERLATA